MNELRAATETIRRFLGMPDGEATELTFFVENRVLIAHATDIGQHVRMLELGQRERGFNGAYMLVNGPINPQIFYRYELNRVQRAWNKRVSDAHIESLRAVFLDCDANRVSGISSSEDEKRAALSVGAAVVDYLTPFVGADAIGQGDSGNGAFVLIAIEATVPTDKTYLGISRLLGFLNRKFGTAAVKIDVSVANPARLMPCPGTLKAKGRNATERPHRMTSFACSESVQRIPLKELIGELS